mmetsp:Transcript_7881/g.11735  ORF Transcript_7881/g.11735 Transcript_7881/m.11735 type:complete len:118 (+) Transcript_7881:520-873(+)
MGPYLTQLLHEQSKFPEPTPLHLPHEQPSWCSLIFTLANHPDAEPEAMRPADVPAFSKKDRRPWEEEVVSTGALLFPPGTLNALEVPINEQRSTVAVRFGVLEDCFIVQYFVCDVTL